MRTKPVRTKEDNIGIRQMATLLRAGYPLSDALRLAIAELVSAAAMAARRTRDMKPPKRTKP
jgi:type II secretory pathway component PulF